MVALDDHLGRTVPATVAELLDCRSLGDDPKFRDALARLVGSAKDFDGRFGAGVADALASVLDIDLGQLLLEGWKRSSQLRDARRRTASGTTRHEEVSLLNHEVASEYHPTIEIRVNDASVARLRFDVTVSIDLGAVVAVVEAGQIVGFRSGDVTVKAELAIGGRTIVERETRCYVGALVRFSRSSPTPPNRPARRRAPARPASRSRSWPRAIIGVLVALALAGLLGVVLRPGPVDVAGTVEGEGWNLRSQPTVGPNVVGTAGDGEAVRVECVSGNWLRLITPQPGVYIWAEAVSTGSTPPQCA